MPSGLVITPSVPGTPGGEAGAPGGGSGHPGGGPGGGGGRYHTALSPASGASGSALLSYPYELSAASLLAAGVLAALGRRRREQLWQRAFGHRVVIPEGDAARAEAPGSCGSSKPVLELHAVAQPPQDVLGIGRPAAGFFG